MPALDPASAPYELRFDSGRVCLDLLATTHPGERLSGVDRLVVWCVGAGLVPRGTPLAGAGPEWLAAFRQLRAQTGRLVRGELDGRPDPRALDRVNALAAAAPPPLRAVRGRDGALVRVLGEDPGCAALIAVVARDAVDLLTDQDARMGLRRCAGDNCPIVYLDTSRGRRRRWCSSEVCGNRERVARHRRRAAVGRG
ncbi:hypothetical protein B1H18_28990 [Streptomyces tsukubensis]|uniref:Zinc finger CGNR domain-containing protein n=1 Tax=Streptomyces tsukubensis TaxID=83656 RepID=A0A1V4A1J5_9ACTN|nr:hypothetical protein B1H18_28990 [Streptomyces tsukubensis]